MPNASDFNRFTVNPVNIDISRSMFDMDHSVKWSCNVGEVIPFDCIEILPGDTVQIDTSKVIRMQPLVAPIFDEIVLDVYWFFVPNRLVWSHWKEFMGENNESAWAPTTEYSIPHINAPEQTINGSQHYCWNVGTIADYLGLPVGLSNNRHMFGGGAISALPFRGYALICDQWFRSEAVMDPVHVHVDDTLRTGSNGSDQVIDIELGGKPFIACKFFDYFTSCLPAPQRGDPVSLSLVSNQYHNYMPVVTKPTSGGYIPDHPFEAGKTTYYNPVKITNWKYGISNAYGNVNGTSSYNLGVNAHKNDPSFQQSTLELMGYNTETINNGSVYFSNLYADITADNFNAVTINDLRSAFAVQRYLEKQARFGGRYISFIKGFFGVDSPDARLQRTEYLGGSRISLNVCQVEQTSATTSNSTPLGNVAGMSVTADQHFDVEKSFTEHGMLFGCAVARYHHSYQDMIHKMWIRNNPLEFYNPVFANLGEQKVLKKQIYGYENNIANYDSAVFGYQEAWAEYRYLPSRISGEMRSVYSTPLDMWHLADHYNTPPSLSPEWLREDKSNLDRCLAVPSSVSNQIICDFYMDMKMTRVMPLYSIPGLIDHH